MEMEKPTNDELFSVYTENWDDLVEVARDLATSTDDFVRRIVELRREQTRLLQEKIRRFGAGPKGQEGG